MSASSFVQLRSGYLVPLDALRLALDLESRGCELLVDGDTILVGPRDRVTDEDRDAIRRWRSHVRAILSYCERGVVQ